MSQQRREELISQLEAIQRALFRDAANLDMIITDLKRDLAEAENDEMAVLYIGGLHGWRENAVKCNNWDEIHKLEDVLWRQLIKTKEES